MFYLLKTCAASGGLCQADHAVFFPRSAKIETESHPVKVTQKGITWHISGCNVSACKWLGSHLQFFSVRISIHSSRRSKLKRWHKANATISMSTVTINNRLKPLFEASIACYSKLVSVSSWLKGWNADKSPSKLFEKTSYKWVAVISTMFAGISVILIARILNSFVLISLFFKNTWDFFAIGVSFLTDILTPISRPFLVCPLIVSVLKVSNAKFSRFKSPNCWCTFYGNSSEQYYPNFFDIFDLLMLTNAAAFLSLISTLGGDRLGFTISFRRCRKSGFAEHFLNFPYCDKETG